MKQTVNLLWGILFFFSLFFIQCKRRSSETKAVYQYKTYYNFLHQLVGCDQQTGENNTFACLSQILVSKSYDLKSDDGESLDPIELPSFDSLATANFNTPKQIYLDYGEGPGMSETLMQVLKPALIPALLVSPQVGLLTAGISLAISALQKLFEQASSSQMTSEEVEMLNKRWKTFETVHVDLQEKYWALNALIIQIIMLKDIKKLQQQGLSIPQLTDLFKDYKQIARHKKNELYERQSNCLDNTDENCKKEWRRSVRREIYAANTVISSSASIISFLTFTLENPEKGCQTILSKLYVLDQNIAALAKRWNGFFTAAEKFLNEIKTYQFHDWRMSLQADKLFKQYFPDAKELTLGFWESFSKISSLNKHLDQCVSDQEFANGPKQRMAFGGIESTDEYWKKVGQDYCYEKQEQLRNDPFSDSDLSADNESQLYRRFRKNLEIVQTLKKDAQEFVKAIEQVREELPKSQQQLCL